MYGIEYRKRAQRQIKKIARRDPQVAKAIYQKIVWLAKHVDNIAHERLAGHDEYSLHSGSYRIPHPLQPGSRETSGHHRRH